MISSVEGRSVVVTGAGQTGELSPVWGPGSVGAEASGNIPTLIDDEPLAGRILASARPLPQLVAEGAQS